MKIINTQNLFIMNWATNLEDKPLEQASNLTNLPFAFHHIALMPDCHMGYGMPIGGVLATKNVVIPNAVGVDIGCGMCAVKTNLKINNISTDQLKEIMGLIREKIPVGFNHRKEQCDEDSMPAQVLQMKIVSEQWQSAKKQLGTLGGGNHFIEIQKDQEDIIWIMVHSGSRNIGYKVAEYYNKLAKDLNSKWHTSVPEKHDLAFLPLDSKEGREYLDEMEYCVKFALANRELMMDDIKIAFAQVLGPVCFDIIINIAHNYAKMENHFGKNVMIHRKGATSARKGEIGIIPGSQGTASYIVEGLGNPESFQSCSHGAGRKMGRNVARKTLSLEDEQKKLKKKGILHSIRNQQDLDEAPGAYKDIDRVMENQKDLIKILVKLEPLAVIKG